MNGINVYWSARLRNLLYEQLMLPGMEDAVPAKSGVIKVAEKIKTIVRISGKDYTIVGGENADYIKRVAAYVDRKIEEITIASRLSPNMVSVLCAVNIADELFTAQEENKRLRRELSQARQALTRAQNQLDTAAANSEKDK